MGCAGGWLASCHSNGAFDVRRTCHHRGCRQRQDTPGDLGFGEGASPNRLCWALYRPFAEAHPQGRGTRACRCCPPFQIAVQVHGSESGESTLVRDSKNIQHGRAPERTFHLPPSR